MGTESVAAVLCLGIYCSIQTQEAVLVNRIIMLLSATIVRAFTAPTLSTSTYMTCIASTLFKFLLQPLKSMRSWLGQIRGCCVDSVDNG